MRRFILTRLAFGVVILFALSIFVFALFYLAPGDPARSIAGDKASSETLELIRRNLGLTQPIHLQYWRFVSDALQGDLGFSYRSDLPVRELIFDRLPATVSLVLGGMVFWLGLGIPIGVASAKRPGSVRDRVGQSFAIVGISFPTFVLGLLAQYLLFYIPTKHGFDLFPPGGYVPLTSDPAGWLWHLILPWGTLALVMAAIYARLTRGQMLEVLGEDYIRTARAKGLSERRVVYRHAFREAMPPLVTQLGTDLGLLLGGVIVIETVFGIQGIGQLVVTSVANQDRPVIIGVVLLGGLFVVLANAVVDTTYALMDSRIRTSART